MEGLTRALAVELAPIRVNIVAPGMVKTPLWANVPEISARTCTGRLPRGFRSAMSVTADEVAQAYVYLMEQTYITGQTLNVDGGGTLV